MSKLIFKGLKWHYTYNEVYEMSNALDCAAHVRPDYKGGFRGVFNYIFKDGFKTQEEAKAWVESEFKKSIEYHIKGVSKES